MKRSAWIRAPLACTLLCLALVLPRASGLGSSAARIASEPNDPSALGYARLRLWSEFLRERETFAKSPLPAPTLAEYRSYLAGLGLVRTGDRMSLVVLPVAGDELPPHIEVRLARIQPPLVLKLYVPGDQTISQLVGHLEILVDANDVVHCRSLAETGSRLLGFWPLRPTPLLP